jgi:hypothetical protein
MYANNDSGSVSVKKLRSESDQRSSDGLPTLQDDDLNSKYAMQKALYADGTMSVPCCSPCSSSELI